MRKYRFLTKVTVVATMAVVVTGGAAAASVWHSPFQPPQPPSPPGVFGTVTAVGGGGTCGTVGVTNDFTLTAYRSSTTWTVDVGSTTTYLAPNVTPPPTIANVCVGEQVGALGSVDTSTDTVTAATVFVTSVITPPTPPPPSNLFGTVTAVSGGGTCLTSNTGTFTLSTWQQTTAWTVTVTPSTTYVQPGNSSAAFSNVCIGSVVSVQGSVDTGSSTVTATKVFITPPPPGVFGQVASVGGGGTCGTVGVTNDFTLTAYRSSTSWTVDVGNTTTYVAPGVTPPATIANVCVGEWVGALGTVNISTDTVAATEVLVAPMAEPPVPHGVFGTVTAVSGGGTCLTSNTGTFTLSTWQQTTAWTVTVTPSTTYAQPRNSSASFSNVCIGSVVSVQGSLNTSTNTVTASHVLLSRSMRWSQGGFSTRGQRRI